MHDNKRQSRNADRNSNPAAEVNAQAAQVETPAAVAPEPQAADKKDAEPLQAGAPLAEEEGEEPGNPYHRIFEDVRFEMSETDTVYTNDRDGLQSKKIAAAIVILRGGFAGVPGTVYARKPKNGDPYADVTFFGVRQQNAIKPLDEQSKADLMDFRRYLAERFIDWRKTQKLATRTPRSAAGVPIDGVTFG